MRELPKEIYKGKIYDKNFEKKNFLLKYKSFLNLKWLRKDKEGYFAYVNSIHDMLREVNFRQNLLFIDKDDISKEIFFDGFLHFNTLKSFMYTDYMKIHDIYWDNTGDELSMSIDPQDNKAYKDTISGINQDILCVYIDKEMFSPKTSEILNSIISSRTTRHTKKGEDLYSWIFFRGYYSDMKNDKWYLSLIKYFESNKSKGFDVVNLNNKGITLANALADNSDDDSSLDIDIPSSLSTVNKVNLNNRGTVINTNNKKTLDEMY